MTPEMKLEYFEDNYYALLASYVAGTLGDAENMIVASHLTLKPEARHITHKMEAVGGAMLKEEIDPVPMTQSALSSVLDRLDRPFDAPASGHQSDNSLSDTDFGFPVPRPIHQYLSSQTPQFAWKKILRGIESFEIPVGSDQKAEFLKIAPGISVPAHTHVGEEITLLLDGAFEDETGHYKQGDMIVLDERAHHHPISDAETGCVCLSVTSAPIKMTGPLMRLLNPFLR